MANYKNNVRRLVALVKSSITGEKLEFDGSFEENFKKIMNLAAFHEVAHLAASALNDNNLLKNEANIKIAKKYLYDASYRDTKNGYTLKTAENILSEGKIPFIALKGAVIKRFYPESWMRTSCDIDILVKEPDFKNALSLFKNNGFKLDGDLNFHDVSLLYDDTNLELHFSICENIKNIDAVLAKVWEYAEKKDGFEYAEEHDFFVFHHIAHMSYHFIAGGCGIRPFLDFWILRKANFFDPDAVKKLCEEAEISAFFDAAQKLTDVWFEGAEDSDVTVRMERYIMTGGAYGYFPNNAAAETIRKGGKIRQVLSILFPPYRNMRVLYPALNRKPLLLPFYYVYRVFEKAVGKDSGRAKEKLRIIKEQDSDFIKEVSSLMKELKLDTKSGGRK